MVFFICNYCGESMKKQVVDRHAFRCKRTLNVSCMDCQKDFTGNEYDAHTSCISEAEKYSGKDYVAKANVNKGAKKQQGWIATIRAITESKTNLPRGITNVFEVIQRNDNIPRKAKGFMNFFRNSNKHINPKDVEAAWKLIEEEVAKEKQTTNPVQEKPQQKEAVTPTNGVQNGAALAKRKLDEDEPQPAPEKKKQKTKTATNGHAEDGQALLLDETNGTDASSNEKFHWIEVIRNLLVSKDNQMKLSKLKKKVMKRYRQATGAAEIDGKFEKKFQKKLNRAEFVIENDTSVQASFGASAADSSIGRTFFTSPVFRILPPRRRPNTGSGGGGGSFSMATGFATTAGIRVTTVVVATATEAAAAAAIGCFTTIGTVTMLLQPFLHLALELDPLLFRLYFGNILDRLAGIVFGPEVGNGFTHREEWSAVGGPIGTAARRGTARIILTVVFRLFLPFQCFFHIVLSAQVCQLLLDFGRQAILMRVVTFGARSVVTLVPMRSMPRAGFFRT
uniref:Uncharacterized protein n=1 Tax=Anopheles farauti TaxID=69004 RepID=A0A182Q8D3_9DIPT